MNSETLKNLTGTTNCKITNKKDLSSTNPSSYTATISGAKKVYNLFPGTVLFLGYYASSGTLTIAVSNHEIVRYLNLSNIQVWNLSPVTAGQYLGSVNSKVGLQFEYCTQWKGDSVYPVRINNSLYFKQNPIDILNGDYIPDKEKNILQGYNRPKDIVKFTQDQLREWGKVEG